VWQRESMVENGVTEHRNPRAEPLVTGAPSFHHRHFARWSLLLVEGGAEVSH
jgi:hypothetical protein